MLGSLAPSPCTRGEGRGGGHFCLANRHTPRKTPILCQHMEFSIQDFQLVQLGALVFAAKLSFGAFSGGPNIRYKTLPFCHV
jgi:hypothetical protein